MHSACKELIEEYEEILREKFSCLISASIEELERKPNRRGEKVSFIQDLTRRYGIKNSKTFGIEELLDTIVIKRKWGITRYKGLYSILQKYVSKETLTLWENYEHLVTGFYEVRTFFDRYRKLGQVQCWNLIILKGLHRMMKKVYVIHVIITLFSYPLQIPYY